MLVTQCLNPAAMNAESGNMTATIFFAEATCDEQWIHVDQERAEAEMPGGKTIAHGLLSLSLAPMFIRSVMGLKGLRTR